ncbi:MAG: alpha/beta hydrolase [Alphaproteobacteria bacterium]|nr:alpha/beta hydrolase [Alphaproteobacteria bacterium]
MTPTRHTLRVKNIIGDEGNHEIAFYDWGNPESLRVTVCVHGLTRNAHDFDVLAETLAGTGRRVLAINMAGRGESDWLKDPMGYNYASYVADCLAVLDNFHLREVEWIGTSMGGVIGMMLASQFPRRIRRLVMNDIGARLSKTALTRIYAYVRDMPQQFSNRTEAETYLRTAFEPWGIADEAIWQAIIDSSLITRDGALRYACDPAIAVPLAAATKNFTVIEDINLSPIWAEVQTPTFILHGADSDILDTETIRAMRATNLNTESISFAGIGHAPALMSEDQIRPIVNWLERTTASIMATSF